MFVWSHHFWILSFDRFRKINPCTWRAVSVTNNRTISITVYYCIEPLKRHLQIQKCEDSLKQFGEIIANIVKTYDFLNLTSILVLSFRMDKFPICTLTDVTFDNIRALELVAVTSAWIKVVISLTIPGHLNIPLINPMLHMCPAVGSKS